MVIVLEDDLIDTLNYPYPGASTMLGPWFEWLVKEINGLIQERKNQLPPKAIRNNWTLVYWVAPVIHQLMLYNDVRTKMALCMLSVIKNYQNMRLIKIKEIWEFQNVAYFTSAGVLSTEGMTTYWAAVTASVKYNLNKWEELMANSKPPLSHGKGFNKFLSVKSVKGRGKKDYQYHRPGMQHSQRPSNSFR